MRCGEYKLLTDNLLSCFYESLFVISHIIERMQKIVVAGFIEKDGKVLLAKRPKTKRIGPDKYHLPGGHVEFGEDLKSALRREILEEFGIDIEVFEPFYSFTYTSEDAHTIGLVCRATIINPASEIVLNDETEEIAWASEIELPNYLADDDFNHAAAKLGFSIA